MSSIEYVEGVREMSNLRLEWDAEQPERIDPEIKTKWVFNLRSGKYAQTEGCLCRLTGGAGYCCLGVLSDQLVDDKKIEWVDWSTDRKAIRIASDEREDYILEESVLPDELAKLLHMTVDGHLCSFSVWNHGRKVEEATVILTSLNDSGMPFSQIADLIEYFL